jgi:circadian clock protein KaiC
MATRTKQIDHSANGEKSLPPLTALKKSPTGIKGLDEISGGGLPAGRTTIVCGGPGSGKTMLGLEFLVRGAVEFNEPGVVLAFEESPEEMTRNVASLGFDLQALSDSKKMVLDYVRVDPSEIQETGEYDLEGLFVRLQYAVDSIGARRVLLDTLEALFSGFSNMGTLRSEIQRLFRWLKERELTAVVTAERGDGALTRHGLEEYVSDCVILLDHRINEQISTRRMRIVKYRGTAHGADEYPFLIDERGLSVLPITSRALEHKASTERVSSGVADLDQMLEGAGYYRGSSVLVSGTAGSGKTTLAAQFADATCRRGERCLYIGFEESSGQIFRNMATLGIDLDQWVKKDLLSHRAWRPTQFGIETHLLRIHHLIRELKPRTMVVDPITNLMASSTQRDVRSMLTRLIDSLKEMEITALFTSLTKGGQDFESTDENVSSLIDSWILLRDMEQNAERNRCLYILKSRGMNHSNQLREFVMTAQGIKLLPVYVGAGQVLAGSSRLAQEAKDQAEAVTRNDEMKRMQDQLEAKRRALQAQIDSLKAELAAEEHQMERMTQQEAQREKRMDVEREEMALSRRADAARNLRAAPDPSGAAVSAHSSEGNGR